MSKLIGTNPNQVPSNADLGTAAFMDKKEFLLSKGSSLSAIDAIVPKTAVDVFIYDTTKDSDGGAWRKRTQHTSWYNEKLNTTTRGSRKEFPVVAVFVAEAARVTIYDGDDINMPMWMQWNTTGALGWASGTSSVWITLTVLNGIFVWGSDNRGLGFANFIKDKIEVIHGAQRYVLKDQSIARRETNVGTITSSSPAQGGYSFPATNDEIYDVAATVLPNAPIDPDTGLPRPTLAYAGPGGLNIIRDNGAVVLITAGSGSSYNGVSWVDFTKNHNLIFEQDNSTNPRAVFCIPVPINNRTTQTNDGLITDKVVMKWYANGAHKPYPLFNGGGVNEGIRLSGDNQAFKSENGDFTILEPNLTDPEQGKVAYIGSDYNTGWMVGDTKLATLSDTDTTNAVGTELITNGTFTSNTTGWGGSGTLSIDSGRLKVLGGYASQNFTTVVGKTYVFTYTVTDGNDGGGIYLGTANSPYVYRTSGEQSTGTYAWTFTATTTSTYIRLYAWHGGSTFAFFDNVSVRLAEEDRSEYDNGLQVFGTIVKTPVRSGAELVGYNASNSTSYLEQPYNSELDFGTAGDFHYSFWVYSDSNATYNGATYIFERTSVGDPSSRRIEARLDTSSNLQVYATSNVFVTGSTALTVNTDSWNKVDIVRKSNVGSVWINGSQKVSGSHSGNMTDTSAKLTVCNRGYFSPHNQGFPSGIALFRVSGTAPSDEQIVKMHNDEKHLFQENAKATLYGTSDAVTALAYDDDTELLHVGTSAGRSDFQGLCRINNTTDAVGAAISASNGFIVED
jgi:hypothetical protein